MSLGGSPSTEFCKAIQMATSILQHLQDLPRILVLAGARSGKSYLVFASFNRGGPCPSALFAYDPITRVATFVHQWTDLGPDDRIPLPGRDHNRSRNDRTRLATIAALPDRRRHVPRPHGRVVLPWTMIRVNL